MDQRRRARVLIAFAVSLGSVSTVLAMFAAIGQMWSNVPPLLCIAPAMLVLLWRIRRGTSIALLGSICGGALAVVALQGAIELGGLGAPPATWLCVIPLMVGLVSGPRAGVISAATSVVASTLLFIFMDGAHGVPHEVRFVDGLIMLAFITMLAAVYEHHKRRAHEELASVNARLEREMRERARVEADLRLAQRLESVGRLAAGVAHEIATPVQYVKDTTEFVSDATRDLVAVLTRHRAVTRMTLSSESEDLRRGLAVDASAIDEASDLEYLLEELPGALHRMTTGLQRIGNIVSSMRQLVHPARQELAEIFLADEIDNTIALAVHEYRDVADVVTDYGDLPPITCRPTEINQVILNLVVNASHAIRDTGARGTITISTRELAEHVEITVKDTGGGIPEGIHDKIFDPFFTTKIVGRGTGQGLAIALSAVERHGGSLTFTTQTGVGTTFVVRLPIVARRSSFELAAA